jgi:hypothetical protein
VRRLYIRKGTILIHTSFSTPQKKVKSRAQVSDDERSVTSLEIERYVPLHRILPNSQVQLLRNDAMARIQELDMKLGPKFVYLYVSCITHQY